MIPTSLLARIYFSKLRARFSRNQIVICAFLITAAIYLTNQYFIRFRFDAWTPLIGQTGVCMAILYGTLILANFGFIGYPGARMMIRPDGAGMWSLHMGPLVSAFSYIYAKLPKDFMQEGAIKILKKAESCGFSGIVILESHILADASKRAKIIEELSINFPYWQMWDCMSREKLKRFDAWALTRHRNALMKKIDKPAGPPLESGTTLGMIVILARC